MQYNSPRLPCFTYLRQHPIIPYPSCDNVDWMCVVGTWGTGCGREGWEDPESQWLHQGKNDSTNHHVEAHSNIWCWLSSVVFKEPTGELHAIDTICIYLYNPRLNQFQTWQWCRMCFFYFIPMAQLQIPQESFTGKCVHQQFIGLCTAPLKSHNGTKSILKFTLLILFWRLWMRLLWLLSPHCCRWWLI